MMTQRVNVVVEHDEHGYYAWCPELQGCHTQGDTLEEVMEHIREAVELYLETLSADERTLCLSRQVYSTSVEVDVA